MKKCVGCKHLVAHGTACKGGEELERHVDIFSGREYYRDKNNPDSVFRPRPREMRADGGRCGPGRSLFAPTFFYKLFPFLYNTE